MKHTPSQLLLRAGYKHANEILEALEKGYTIVEKSDQESVGLYYCTLHCGAMNEDSSICDFYDSDDGTDECSPQELFYKVEA